MEPETIVLPDIDAWDSFAASNREALEESYGSIADAYHHVVDGGLTLGGGAAPQFFICFEM